MDMRFELPLALANMPISLWYLILLHEGILVWFRVFIQDTCGLMRDDTNKYMIFDKYEL